MTHLYQFGTISEALPAVMGDLLDFGDEVGSRNGRVKEFLNAQIVLTDPTRREVLSINRKANVFAQIAETVWVISGRNDVEWLSAYLPRAVDYSDDGKVWRGGYGPRLRAWTGHSDFPSLSLDQLQHVLALLRNDPLSRRAVIAIYDPATDAAPGKDIPCNDFLQFQSRAGELHLTVTVRSNDIMWGWSGINAFEWSTLQEIVASILGIRVGTLTFNIGSLHLYEPHWDKAERLEYENVRHRVIPFDPHRTLCSVEDLDSLLDVWFAWEKVCREGGATRELLDNFPDEPLFKSWAAAIAYFWQGEDHWLAPYEHTALALAVARTPLSVFPEARQTSRSTGAGHGHPLAAHERTGAFYAFVSTLHAVKHESYGDSWKKRGEKMSILANMARKVDRLGVGDEFDSSSDTLIDLMVYAIKYGCWLTNASDAPVVVNVRLAHYLAEAESVSTKGEALDITYVDIANDFNYYCDNIDGITQDQKIEFVRDLIKTLAPIARDVWAREQPTDEYLGADHE